MRNKIAILFTGIIVVSLICSFSVPYISAQDMFWPGDLDEWTEEAPETQGLDPDKIAEMVEFIGNNSYDLHSVIITRNGHLLTEEYLWESKIYLNLPQ